ncbi:hypothetical protein DPMN_071775 [Dreissena polymorpha]|uniref:Uncharacterized protein n=1 Tax=Dreissena polymorpha TaxID=45954 RepID=A0A9D4BPY7_DREPO|nr:hypothetical protein DPMN_071775 [Dreissena polymorpha]
MGMSNAEFQWKFRQLRDADNNRREYLLKSKGKYRNATEIDPLVVPFSVDGTINEEPETGENNIPPGCC